MSNKLVVRKVCIANYTRITNNTLNICLYVLSKKKQFEPSCFLEVIFAKFLKKHQTNIFFVLFPLP